MDIIGRFLVTLLIATSVLYLMANLAAMGYAEHQRVARECAKPEVLANRNLRILAGCGL